MESISLESTEPAELEKGQYGEKMKYEASGPYEKLRTKTDFCWLIGFIVYLAIWCIVILYAYMVGDTTRSLKPKDSVGRVCGYDIGVETKPFLAYYDTDSVSLDHAVCLSKCPEKDFEFEYDVKPSNQSNANAATENSRKTFNDMDGEKQKQIPNNNMNLEESKRVDEDKSKSSGSGTSGEPQKLTGDANGNLGEPEKPKVDNNGNLEEPERPKTGNNGNSETPEKPEAVSNESSEKPKKLQEEKTENSAAKNTPEQIGISVDSTKKSRAASTATQQANKTNIDPNESQNTKLARMKAGIICKSDVNLKLIHNLQDLQYFVNRGMCSRSYKKIHCSSNFTTIQKVGLTLFTEDISKTKFSILGFIALSGAITLAIVFLLRWYAMMYVCMSIFAICAMAFDLIYEYYVVNGEDKTDGALLALFFGIVITVLVIVVAIYFRQQISLACQMIKESSKAITCVLSSLAVPLIIFLQYALIFTLGVSVYFQLASITVPVYRADFAVDQNETCHCPDDLGYKQNSICEPATFSSQCRRKPSNDECVLSGCYMATQAAASMGFLHFLNFFGLIWSYWFISGYMDTVLASVFATWYWTFNKKILSYMCIIESFWRITTYHLGSIALGSLILIVCKIIRLLLNSLERGLRKSKRPQVAVILLSLQCVFAALERSVNFISQRAYIMCAMHGTDFFNSARTAFYLIKRNISRVVVVSTVTSWLTFITTCLVVSITTRISISYYGNSYSNESGERELNSIISPIIFIVIGSYVIAWMLMRVVEVAVETVFLCFLEDIERNDGTNERPYFMSDELTKFLYKK